MLTLWTSLIILATALAWFALIGVRAHQRGDVDDYLVARDSQPAGSLALSFFASGLGAWILFAPPEVGATVGAVAVAGYGLAAAAPFVVFAAIGPAFRHRVPHGLSLTEVVRERFGPLVHAYVVGISALYMLMFVTAELTAVGGLTAILSDLDGRVAILAVVVATLAYTAYGGLRASLRTDGLQGWMVLALTLIVLGVLAAQGDSGAARLPDAIRVDRAGIEAGVTLIIAVTAANLFHQGYWQRVWAAHDDRALVQGALWGGLGSIPVVLGIGLLGVAATAAGVDIGSPPVPFFALIAGAGTWVAGAALLLGTALVASSVDTLENGLAALVAVERRRPTLTGARVATVLAMVPAAAVAFQGYSVLRLLLIADLLAATILVPALLVLWRRATPLAALSGGLAGLLGAILPETVATGSLADAVYAASFPGAVPTLAPFAGALAGSTLASVGVALVNRRAG